MDNPKIILPDKNDKALNLPKPPTTKTIDGARNYQPEKNVAVVKEKKYEVKFIVAK